MTTAVGSGTSPTQTTPTSSTTPSSSTTSSSKSCHHGDSRSGYTPSKGDSPPSDFGHRRNPDFDGDGKISDAEATVYRANMRSADSRYTTDSRERIAHEKEVAKNYRAEVTAHTAHVHDAHSNKLHKMFGFSFASPPPEKPEKPF